MHNQLNQKNHYASITKGGISKKSFGMRRAVKLEKGIYAQEWEMSRDSMLQ